MLQMILNTALILSGTYITYKAATAIWPFIRPTLKGKAGERAVNRVLGRVKEKGARLRDIMVRGRSQTAQIDNLLINRYGVFVIETKNYSGKVKGGMHDARWLHIAPNGYSTHDFLNPTIQNQGHVNALRSLLKDYPQLKYYPLVVFSNKCELPDKLVNVVKLRDLDIAIASRCNGEPILDKDEVKAIKKTLLENNISGRAARKKHVTMASLGAKAASSVTPEDIDRLVEQGLNSPLISFGDPPPEKKELPSEREQLTDKNARLTIKGKTGSIEDFFEDAKRDARGRRVQPGADCDHFVCPYTGDKFSKEESKAFYEGLWITYLNRRPDLMSYMQQQGAGNIRCVSHRTERTLNAYAADPQAFQEQVRASAWYQNMQQKLTPHKPLQEQIGKAEGAKNKNKKLQSNIHQEQYSH